jgi:hypothetical protein
MPTIPNFPQDLAHEHHAWHVPSAHPELPTRRILPPNLGAGLEFLTFHRDFIAQFHRWYDSQPFADQNAVAPWILVPPELKVARAGWNSRWEDDERRIQTNNPPFASADELGLFIELGIHNNFLHGATAVIFNEPIVSMPLPSPESTFFYKIHGLVDHWWQLWEQQRGNLWWYRHDGWQEGTEEMRGRNLVGRGGWQDYRSVFASSDGIIYGIG